MSTQKMRCATCTFCDLGARDADRTGYGKSAGTPPNICRRRPPRPHLGEYGNTGSASWPPVYDEDWCGEWVAR